MLRLVDAYNLYLRELMQAVQSANILAVATSLTAETLCVCAVLDGQVFLIEDNVAVDVCYGNLSRWDKIQVVYLTMIHLSLLVRQLSRAVA